MGRRLTSGCSSGWRTTSCWPPPAGRRRDEGFGARLTEAVRGEWDGAALRAFVYHPNISMHRDMPFTHHFVGRLPGGGFGWLDNPLTRADAELITERPQRLLPDFEQYGMRDAYEAMMDRLYHLSSHAGLRHDHDGGGVIG